MGLISRICLRVLHFIYALCILLRAFWQRHAESSPSVLQATRNRIPKHLAVLLVSDKSLNRHSSEDAIVQSVVRAAGWCRSVGVGKLTVYEEKGTLLSCAFDIREQLQAALSGVNCYESDTAYPPTPPASDYSESRPLSPSHRVATAVITIRMDEGMQRDDLGRMESHRRRMSTRRQTPGTSKSQTNPLTICLASRESSKPAIASAARSLALAHVCSATSPFELSVEDFNTLLEDEDGLSSPDFMIIHPLNAIDYNQTPCELHGYPPWHISLTEIFHSSSRRSLLRRLKQVFGFSSSVQAIPLQDITFREALDEFSGAEMRFGK